MTGHLQQADRLKARIMQLEFKIDPVVKLINSKKKAFSITVTGNHLKDGSPVLLSDCFLGEDIPEAADSFLQQYADSLTTKRQELQNQLDQLLKQ